jgi:hypothetical protein
LLGVALVWSGLRVLRIDRTLHGVMIETAKTTSLVFIILLGAAMLTAAFRAFGGEELVRDFLNSLPGGFWTQFVIVMAVIFVLGFFLDFIEIAVVVVPIVAPILLADPSANITAVWLGVMIGLNIQTSFLTPPFGFALFYLRGVAPAVVKTVQMYKGVIAFICLQLLALGIVGVYPQLVNYLPNRVSLTSETAPPPRNPKLQHCLESYVHEQLNQSGDKTTGAITAAKALDLSLLPKKLAGELEDGFEQADTAIASLDEAMEAEKLVAAATDAYRPQLRLVRRIEKKIRKAEEEVAELNQRIGRMRDPSEDARKAALQEDVDVLNAEIAELKGDIPESWDGTYKEFSALLKAETSARQTYRRSADGSYEAALEVLAVLNSNDAFAALEADLRSLRDRIETGDPAELQEQVNELSKAFGKVDGANNVKSALSKSRRALRAKQPDPAKAAVEYDKAIAAFEEQSAWRGQAAEALAPGLQAYLAGISDTLGSRLQPKLSRKQALYLAACNAGHRDISLNF